MSALRLAALAAKYKAVFELVKVWWNKRKARKNV